MQSIESEHLELVKALLAAFVRSDVAKIRAILTDDVCFHFPGRNQFSGDYRGVNEALLLLAKVAAWTGGTAQIRMHDVLANEQHGVLLYTVTARHNTREITYRYTDLYHFRQGRISEVWGTPSDAPEFDAFYNE